MSLVPSESDPGVFYFFSNITNTTYTLVSFDTDLFLKTEIVVESICILLGTFINVWFLTAILTSQDMRTRLRNKLLCNVYVSHLVTCALFLPIYMGIMNYYKSQNYMCHIRGLLQNLYQIQDFIANWLLVILIVVFIAQILDFDFSIICSSLVRRIGTWALLIGPWITAIVAVPIIIHVQVPKEHLYYHEYCLVPHNHTKQLFKILDTAVPILLQIVLLSTAAILKFRRLKQGSSSGDGGTELLSRRPPMDNTLAYVAAVVVCVICDVLKFLGFFISFNDLRIIAQYSIRTSSLLLANIRVLLMPLAWLLLVDIRQRIKTWRPCCRSAPSSYTPGSSTDVTVTYRKHMA